MINVFGLLSLCWRLNGIGLPVSKSKANKKQETNWSIERSSAERSSLPGQEVNIKRTYLNMPLETLSSLFSVCWYCTVKVCQVVRLPLEHMFIDSLAMPNPGKFQGKRKVFLTEKRPLFDASVENNRVPDVLLKIYCAYFRRFPMDMPKDIKPTGKALALVDDNAPEPEVDTTALDELSGEVYEAALEKMREGQVILEAKKGVSDDQ